jgi:hypothetical protein
MHSSNDALVASAASAGLKVNREVLLLGGGGLGWGEEGEEGVHFGWVCRVEGGRKMEESSVEEMVG